MKVILYRYAACNYSHPTMLERYNFLTSLMKPEENENKSEESVKKSE